MTLQKCSRAGKYLTFRLGREEYGIDVMKVREIMAVPDITPVPGTLPHLKGVMNLRGRIVPVVDLRIRFSCGALPFSEHTCVIVVQVTQGGELAMLGLIVDSVTEVLNLANTDIEDPPDFGEKGDNAESPFVLGIARWKGTVKILLKIEEVLTLQELRGIEAIQALSVP